MTPAPFAIDASRAALLVIDLQNDFVREDAPQEVPDARATLGAAASLLDACRAIDMPIVFTRYTAGPESTHQGWFSPECEEPTKSCWPGTVRCYDDRDGALAGHDVVDELQPLTGEVIVDKYGYGSFHNTVLEDVLRARKAGQVWTIGTVTQICVEETIREGFRRGLEMVVAADAVSSFDAELHSATLRNMAQKFALITCTNELIREITRADT